MDKTLQELHDKYTDRLKELEKSFNEYREIENMQKSPEMRLHMRSNTRLAQGKLSMMYRVVNDLKHLLGIELIGVDSNHQGVIYNQE